MVEQSIGLDIRVGSGEQPTPLETAKSEAMMVLAEKGFVSFHMDGSITCHENAFRSMQIRELGLRPCLTKVSGNKSAVEGLVKLFDGIEVFLDNNPEKKPLFVVPENKDISPESIKQIKGHFKLWEVVKNNLPTAYPTIEDGFASELSMKEFRLMDLIFRQGEGERDQNGVLWVTKDGSRKPISSTFLVGQGEIYNHPSRWFKENLPHWLEKGWITKADFREQAGGEGDLTRIVRTTTQDKGMVMLNRVRYTLGTEYASHRIVTIERGNMAAIMDGKKVAKLFRLIDPGENSEEYLRVNKSDIEFIDVESISNQSVSSVVAMIESESFGKFLDFSERLERDYGIDMSKLSIHEQGLAYEVAKLFGSNEDFWRYIGKNRSPGLKAFMLGCGTLQETQKTIDIGKLDGSTLLLTNTELILDLLTSEEEVVRSDEEQIRLREFNRAALGITSELFFSAQDRPPQEVSEINNALWETFRLLQETYQREFRLGNGGLYQEWTDTLSKNGSTDDRSAVLMTYLRSELFERILRLPDERDPHGAERALTQAVVLLNQHPEWFVDSDIFAMGDRRVVYRMLARSGLPIEAKMKVVGRTLTFADMDTELKTIRSLVNDPHLQEPERNALQEMINTATGIVDGQKAPGVPEFYSAFDFGNFPSHTENIELQHKAIVDRLQKYGNVTPDSRVRDIGSGLGDLVHYLQTLGFTDVRGLDLTAEYVNKAEAAFGEHFDYGDMFHLDLPLYDQVDAFVLQNNILAHAVGAQQKRAVLSEMAGHLKPGGIILFDSGDPEKTGSKYEKITQHGTTVLEQFGVPSVVAASSGISISSPDGIQFMTRHFPKQAEWRKIIAGVDNLEIVDIVPDETALEGDERMVIILRKRG